MTLHQAQVKFSKFQALLIQKAFDMGYEVTGGEWQRSPMQAQWNAKTGKGIAKSNHILSLAIDLHLFKAGVFLTLSEQYKLLGDWWKTLTDTETTFCWGGDFSKPDGNHFSFEWNGVK